MVWWREGERSTHPLPKRAWSRNEKCEAFCSKKIYIRKRNVAVKRFCSFQKFLFVLKVSHGESLSGFDFVAPALLGKNRLRCAVFELCLHDVCAVNRNLLTHFCDSNSNRTPTEVKDPTSSQYEAKSPAKPSQSQKFEECTTVSDSSLCAMTGVAWRPILTALSMLLDRCSEESQV